MCSDYLALKERQKFVFKFECTVLLIELLCVAPSELRYFSNLPRACALVITQNF